MKHDAGKPFTHKISWDALFGYVCWDIWVACCTRLFDSSQLEENQKGLSSFFRACVDKDLLIKYNLSTNSKKTTNNKVTGAPLEVDGSVCDNGSSGCGGIIKDEQER